MDDWDGMKVQMGFYMCKWDGGGVPGLSMGMGEGRGMGLGLGERRGFQKRVFCICI